MDHILIRKDQEGRVPVSRGCGISLGHCAIALFKGKVAMFKALFKQSSASDKGI